MTRLVVIARLWGDQVMGWTLSRSTCLLWHIKSLQFITAICFTILCIESFWKFLFGFETCFYLSWNISYFWHTGISICFVLTAKCLTFAWMYCVETDCEFWARYRLLVLPTYDELSCVFEVCWPMIELWKFSRIEKIGFVSHSEPCYVRCGTQHVINVY